MGIENYDQKDGNKYGGQAQLISSTDGIIPPIFKSLTQFLEFDAGAYLLLMHSYRLKAQMSTNEKISNNLHNSSPSNRTKSYNTDMPWNS